MTERKYKLVIRVYEAETDLDDLKGAAAKVLSKYLNTCSISWSPHSLAWYSLTVEGRLSKVDSCHFFLNRDCFTDVHVVRDLDEAGDDLRGKAFPVLARAEQRLRSFVNTAMTEVSGPDWWRRWCPPSLAEKASERQARTKPKLHEVEFVDFKDLITLMTAELQDWPSESFVRAADLSDLIADIKSIEELRSKISLRVSKRSAWNDIFARYFAGTTEGNWEELSAELRATVIPLRNKVMHHRPFHQAELDRLRKFESDLSDLLDRSSLSLSEEERHRLAEVSRHLTASLHHVFAGTESALAELSAVYQDAVSPLVAESERLSSLWLEIQENMQRQTEPVIRAQEELERQLEKMAATALGRRADD